MGEPALKGGLARLPVVFFPLGMKPEPLILITFTFLTLDQKWLRYADLIAFRPFLTGIKDRAPWFLHGGLRVNSLMTFLGQFSL